MLHNAMYNGIVMLWPPIQMLILACHTGAGMRDEAPKNICVGS